MLLCLVDNSIWTIIRRLKRFMDCIMADKHMTPGKIWVDLEGAVSMRTRRDCSKTTRYSLKVLYVLQGVGKCGIGS